MAFLQTLLLLSSLVIIGQCQLSYNTQNAVHSAFEVNCTDDKIRVYFNRTELDSRTDANNVRPWSIGFSGQLTDAACNINDTHTANQANGYTMFSNYAWIETSLPGGCGLTELEDNDNIIYSQTITITYGSDVGVIRREEYDSYNVMCLRNRTVYEDLTGDYFNTTFRETGSDAKNNTAEFEFSVVHSDNNDAAKTEYKLGEIIKITVEMTTVLESVKAVVQRCWTTSDGSNNDYKLIDNRCISDPGSSFVGSTAKVTQFKTEAYRYLGSSTSSIYVECLVRVCLSATATAECSPCSARKRRDVGETKGETKLEVVRSPIFYIVDAKERDSTNSQQGSDSFMAGSNGIIVIVLLALLVFVAALAVIKKLFFSEVTVQVPTVSLKGIDNKGMA